MPSLGLDFADARPGGAALKSHGVVGVGRYLSTAAKGLTSSEVSDYKAHGVGIWVVYEGATRGMLGGKAQGVTDAHAALTRANALGLGNCVIYWAADYDIGPGYSEIAATDAYVEGWNTVIPPGRRGGYGGLWYLQHIGAAIEHRWECGSTSFRHGVDPNKFPVDIRQTTITPPIADTDHNYVYATGSFVGQTGSTPTSTPTSSEGDDMALSATDLSTISDMLQRATRYRVYYNEKTKKYFAVNWNMPSGDAGKIIYANAGPGQVNSWHNMEITGDTIAQAIHTDGKNQPTQVEITNLAHAKDTADTEKK